MNREHYPAAEPVEQTILVLNGKTCLHKKVLFVSIPDGLFRESITFFETVTNLKFLKSILPEASFFEICKPNGYSFICMKKIFSELPGSIRRNNKKALPFILFFKLFLRELFLNNLNIIFLCKVF